MKNKINSPELGGAHGSTVEELEEIINDLNSGETLYVLSVKMKEGLTVYSYPGKRESIDKLLNELIDSIDAGEMHKVGATWVAPQYVITVRTVKYLAGEDA